jgi:hypothetical protein
MSFFQTYRSTEGLDQFHDNEKFHVWRAAHKRLKTNDPAYRVRCRRYFWNILLTSLVVVAVSILASRLDNMIEGSLISLAALAVFLPYILIVSFRQQRWLNAKVAEEIKNQPNGT